MQNNLGKTLTYSDLVTDFSMGGPNEGNGIINLGAMIAGKTNFKIMYNALTRLNTNEITSSTSELAIEGDPIFTYGQKARYILVKNSQSEILDHNVIRANILGTLANNNTSDTQKVPVLTPLFSNGTDTTLRWEADDAIYYFIPAITSSTPGWIALGVKSTCWSHDDSSKNRWIIGRRVQLQRNFNYIFKVSKKSSSDAADLADYVWTRYMYSNDGTWFNGPITVPMDRWTYDGYNSANLTGVQVTVKSVNNRLSGNFYDILRGLNAWQWDVANANRNSSVFLCNTRGALGTSSALDGSVIVHAAPHAFLGSSSSYGYSYWSGNDRPFQLYRHITYLDLGLIYSNSMRTFNFLMLYPGYVSGNGSSTQTGPLLYQGNIIDLDTNLGSSASAIVKINQYNRNRIAMVSAPNVSSGGRVMYIIPYVELSNEVKVYCNYYASQWEALTAQNPTENNNIKNCSYTISPGYFYIIECWVLGNGVSAMKVYQYDSTGGCVTVSPTIRTGLAA